MKPASQHEHAPSQMDRARKGARRTAWVVAGIALAVYVGFLLIGALGK